MDHLPGCTSQFGISAGVPLLPPAWARSPPCPVPSPGFDLRPSRSAARSAAVHSIAGSPVSMRRVGPDGPGLALVSSWAATPDLQLLLFFFPYGLRGKQRFSVYLSSIPPQGRTNFSQRQMPKTAVCQTGARDLTSVGRASSDFRVRTSRAQFFFFKKKFRPNRVTWAKLGDGTTGISIYSHGG